MSRKLWNLVCLAALLSVAPLCKKATNGLHTPSVPSAPAGPSTGITDSSCLFRVCSTDPDGDQVCYRVVVNERDTSGWSRWVDSGDTFDFPLVFDNPGTYLIKAQAKDGNDSISDWSDAHTTVISHGPSRAPVLDAFRVIPVQFTTLKYQSRAYPYDPDGDSITCRWVWGDGDTTPWTPPVALDIYVSPWGHQYSSPGSYLVRAQAKDEWGLVSSWTDAKTVVANDPDGFPWKDDRRFDLPLDATSVVMHPSGDRYFVAGRHSGVAAMSMTGDTALGMARIPCSGSDDDDECPLGMSPDGSFLYVTSEYTNQVWKIRSSDMAVTDSVWLGRPLYDLAVSADGQYLYVTSYRTLLVLNASTMSVEDTVVFGTALKRIVVNPSGAFIYLASWDPPALYVVRTPDFATEATLAIWCTQGVCVKPDGSCLYVGCEDSAVAVIRTSDHSVVQSVPVMYAPSSLCVTPDGQYVYATSDGPEYCGIVRTVDNGLRGYTHDKWYSVAFTPDGQTAYAVYSTTAIVLTP
jgi:DNA-binding beta-propeller fold protein YncE